MTPIKECGMNISSKSTFNITIPTIIYNDSFGNTSCLESADIYYPVFAHPVHIIVLYSFAYGVVFLLAFFGNLIVVIVVWRHRWMHTVTNFFIVNLAIADIMVAVFNLPITLLSNIYTGWPYGLMMCKTTVMFQNIAVGASVYTLAAIAVDRLVLSAFRRDENISQYPNRKYLAICYTLNYKLTGKSAKIVMFFVWLFAISFSSVWPMLYKYSVVVTPVQEIPICSLDWPSVGVKTTILLLHISLFYAAPLLLIIACYSLIGLRVWFRNAPGILRNNGVIQKSKVKAIKMLVMVVVLFMLSWLPLYVMNTVLHLNPPTDENVLNFIYNYVAPISQLLGSSNSGINPIIYCLFSKKIRIRIKAMLRCHKQTAADCYKRQVTGIYSTKYVSVDYTDGHVTMRTCANHRNERPSKSTSTNKSLSNTMYD